MRPISFKRHSFPPGLAPDSESILVRSISVRSLAACGALVVILLGCTAAPPETAPEPILPAVTGVPPISDVSVIPDWPDAPSDDKPGNEGGYLPELEAVRALRADANGRYIVSTMLFATDRDLEQRYAPTYPERGEAMRYGECVVTLPTDRPMGETGAPSQLLSLLGIEEEKDPEEHVILHHILQTGRERFDRLLRQGYSAKTAGNVLLFVHGFNVPFDNACRRLAQLVVDLKFDGVPVLFSWPSEGLLQSYFHDEEELLLSQLHLRDLLVHLLHQTDGKQRHLIAHSLGARGLINAIMALPAAPEGKRYFNNIVLAAPDVNQQLFLQLGEGVMVHTDRLTLYASSNDQALKVSHEIHGYSRLGEAGASLTVLPGMDTIDATNADTSLLGHGYYSSNAPILSDLYGLVTSGLPPGQRFQLRRRSRDGLPYWEFRRLE